MAKGKAQDLLLPLHSSATMVSVSDPIFFNVTVEAVFKDRWGAIPRSELTVLHAASHTAAQEG